MAGDASKFANVVGGRDAQGNPHSLSTDSSGNLLVTGSSANLATIDAADGAINTTAPLFAEQVGAQDQTGRLQALQVDVSGNLKVTAASGSTVVVTNADPLAPYKIQDEDSLALVKYFGFASSTNKNRWIILKQDTTTSPYSYRYANLSNNATRTDYGNAGASGAWVNRAALNYDYLYNLTGL